MKMFCRVIKHKLTFICSASVALQCCCCNTKYERQVIHDVIYYIVGTQHTAPVQHFPFRGITYIV